MRHFSLFLLILFFAVPSFAQWSGSVGASAGSNFYSNHNERLDFSLHYDAKRLFFFDLSLGAGHSLLPTLIETYTFDASVPNSASAKDEIENIKNRRWFSNVSSIFGFRLSPYDLLRANISYRYAGATKLTQIRTVRYRSLTDSIDGLLNDTALSFRHLLSASLDYSHHFSRPASLLSLSAIFSRYNSSLNTLRYVYGPYYPYPDHYSTDSTNRFLSFDFAAHYSDSNLFNVPNLRALCGVDLSFVNNNGSYLVQDVDSSFISTTFPDINIPLSFSANCTYRSLEVDPFFNLNYSIANFDFSLSERLHIFQQSLTASSAPFFDTLDIHNILSAYVAYTLASAHRFSLNYDHSIKRPDFTKLCPTFTIGKTQTDFFLGNPYLKPEIFDRIAFAYDFSFSPFRTSLAVSYSSKRDVTEKILVTISDSSDIYSFDSWFNTQRQQTFSTRLALSTSLPLVSLDIWGSFNVDNYQFYSNKPRLDLNFDLGAKAFFHLSPSLDLSFLLSYVSPRQSTFRLKDEYVGANIRLTKYFSKNFFLYLECSEVVDLDQSDEQWNVNYTFYKIKSTDHSRRALILGFSYSF